MNPGARSRAEAIFAQVFELPAGERTRALEVSCAGDDALCAEVRALLADFEKAGDGFLSPEEIQRLTALGKGALETDEERRLPAGTKVDEFVIESFLGAGGMGVVYIARQEQPSRAIALKVIRGAYGTRGLVRRFEHEAEVLARLQHPGIAQVYRAGSAEIDGLNHPYIAMELVRGKALVTHCREGNLPAGERVALVAEICKAVEHAHQRGVIHRDLKPQNILVDEHGRPKVLDFGVARVTSKDAAMTTLRTSVGQLIGTLAYMSPEQIAGDPGEIDTRSDVYAIGVILYQLLAGKLPHDVASRTIPEAARIIREDSPTRLSRVSRTLRGELEIIVGKAMEKDKERRYQSAAALGEDLRRYLAGEPILASPDTLYVVGKKLARYRWAVAGSLMAMLALALFGVYASWQAGVQRSLALLEQQSRLDADASRELADRRAVALERALYFSRIGHAHAAVAGGDLLRARELLDACRPEDRGWEWRHILHLTDESTVIGEFKGEARYFVASHDRETLFYSDEYGVIRRIRADTGEELQRVQSDVKYLGLALSPDQKELIAAVFNGDLHRINAETGEIIGAVGRMEGADRGVQLQRIRWSPDGSRFAVTDIAGGIWQFDRGSTAARNRIQASGSAVLDLVYLTPEMLVYATREGEVRVIDDRSGAVIRKTDVRESPVSLAFDDAKETIFIGGFGAGIMAWQWRTEDVPRFIGRAESTVRGILPIRGGTQVIVAGRYPILESWDVQAGQRRWMQRGEPAEFLGLYRSVDDDVFRTLGTSGQIRQWKLDPEGTVPTIATPARIVFGALATVDGKRIVLTDRSGAAYSVDVQHRSSSQFLSMNHASTRSLGELPGGTILAARDDGSLVGYAPDGARTELKNLGQGVTRLAISPDRLRVAVIDGASTLTIVRGADLSPIRSIQTGLAAVSSIVWTRDGMIVIASGEGVIQRWSEEGDRLGGDLRMPARISAIKVSPDGSLMFVALENDSMQRIALPDAVPIGEPIKTGSRTADITYLPDGSRVFTGHADRTIRVWDAATGEAVTTLTGHTTNVSALMMLDQDTLASVDSGGTIRLWLTGQQSEGVVPVALPAN